MPLLICNWALSKSSQIAPLGALQIRDEIEALHQFFVDWFSGGAPDRDDIYEARLLRRIDPSFCFISPDGAELNRSALANGMRKGHGSNPDFRIAIRDVNVRAVCGNHVEPYAYLADVLAKIVNGHLNSAIDEPLPWAYPKAKPLKDAA